MLRGFLRSLTTHIICERILQPFFLPQNFWPPWAWGGKAKVANLLFLALLTLFLFLSLSLCLPIWGGEEGEAKETFASTSDMFKRSARCHHSRKKREEGMNIEMSLIFPSGDHHRFHILLALFLVSVVVGWLGRVHHTLYVYRDSIPQGCQVGFKIATVILGS